MKQAITQYLMVVLLIVGAYFLGVYKTKTEFLEKGVTGQVAQVQPGQQQTTPTTVDLKQIQD